MRVTPATARDGDRILDMLKKSFFVNEPLNSTVGLVADGGRSPELEDYCRAPIPSGYSLIGLDEEDGTIVGVILNDLLHPENLPGPEDVVVRPDASKFDKIMVVNHAVERAFDVFAVYPNVSSALDVKILATDPSKTKQGIAATLMEQTVELARSRGLKLVRCVCSGAYSARIAARFGFTKLGALPYDEILGPDGAPVISPPAPHTAISMWALPL